MTDRAAAWALAFASASVATPETIAAETFLDGIPAPLLRYVKARTIEKYGTLSPRGYNLIAEMGETAPAWSGESLERLRARTKEAMSRQDVKEKHRATNALPATKARRSAANMGNKYALGHRHTTEAREKMSIAAGIPRHVSDYTYPSLSAAARAFGLTRRAFLKRFGPCLAGQEVPRREP